MMGKVCRIIICAWLGMWFCPAALAQSAKGVVINEIMASNTKTLKDSQSQYDDWIELYNATGATMDVGGMYLTDTLSDPLRWRIPAGTTIGPHATLLIWADGDLTAQGLHAGFSLSAGGEQVGLSDANGALVDSIAFKEQMADVSYGRWPDGNDTWQYMAAPTPGAANKQGYEGLVADVEVSPHRGFYQEPLEVTLTTSTAGAEVWYTVNGDKPHAWIPNVRGGGIWTGQVYAGPIRVATTTCIRAVAARPGWKDSAVASHTLIFLADVIRQSAGPAGFPSTWGGQAADYAMDQRVVAAYSNEIRDDLKGCPSVCITVPVADFFGPSGIYSNPSASGRAYERAATMEWIDPVKADHFGVNAGLRIQGGVGRSNNIKKPLRFFFRSDYGPSKLDYPIFQDTAVHTFDSVVLRSIWNYSWTGDSSYCSGLGNSHADYLRDSFGRDTIRDMDGLVPHGRPVNLYINGLYWGLYSMTERPDDHFAAEYLGGQNEDYDVLKAPDSSIVPVSGDLQAWNTLFSMADTGVVSAQAYQAIQQVVDVRALIDYMLMIYYTGSRDAPTLLCSDASPRPRNFYAIRRRNPPGPFYFMAWDVEWSLEDPSANRVEIPGGASNPHYLVTRLAGNAEFRMLLADRIHRHFHNGGTLTRDSATSRYLARAGEAYGAIVGESARWGDVLRSPAYTRVDWQNEVDRLVNQYFSGRTETVLDQLKTQGWYPSVEAPSLLIDAKQQYGGRVRSGAALGMASSSPGSIYYTLDGTDPRPVQTSASQVQTTTLVAEDATKRVLVPTGPINDAWKGGSSFDDSAWTLVTGSPGGVGYDRTPSPNDYSYWIGLNVEAQVYAVGTHPSCYIRIPFALTTSDLESIGSLTLKIRYDDGFVAFLNGVQVLRAGFAGTPAWNSRASGIHEAGASFSSYDLSGFLGSLRPGENILAIQGLNATTNSDDLLIVAELMGSRSSSPGTLYKGSITLTRSARVKARVSNGTAWSALSEAVYSVGPVAEGVRISEMMVHPKDPNCEFVELTNTGSETINLALVQFTQGIHFTFPALDLAPGQHTLVVSDVNAFEAVYGKGLPVAGVYSGNLSNGGEQIQLMDAAGQVIEDFTYSAGWYDLTDGLGFSLAARDVKADPQGLSRPDYWRPSTCVGGTPGKADALASVPEPGAIVVNELLANSPKGRPDWIELYNTTDRSIDISGWFLSDDANALDQYAIPAGTVIEGHGYKVFNQEVHFGRAFGLSAEGETVYVQAASGGQVTGYSTRQKFGASEPGVSLGRHVNSTGGVDFVAMTEATQGGANSQPRTGPVVISEIMYQPVPNQEAEYVELMNAGTAPVVLADPCTGQSWRLTDGDNPGVEFVFPLDRAVILQPGQRIVVVKNVGAFGPVFAVGPGIEVFEWLAGSLDNGGDWVRLYRPSGVDGGEVRWILVDQVHYSDGAHGPDFAAGVDPWPKEAAGQGRSLGRVSVQAYGNDVGQWQATGPSPGQ